MGDVKVGKYTVNEDLEARPLSDGSWYWLASVSDGETQMFRAVGLITLERQRPTPEVFIAEYKTLERKGNGDSS